MIVSTSKGVMTDKKARELNVGGELLKKPCTKGLISKYSRVIPHLHLKPGN
jgi:hypothetical protein